MGIGSKTKARQRNKEKHIKNGLCIYCSKKAIDGIQMCEYHRAYIRKYRLKKKNEDRL